MSILAAGNLITKLSLNFQTRLVSLPWLKRSGIRCFAHNADEPRFPVRYIPKKHRDVKQTQNSSSKDSSFQYGMPNSNVRGRNSMDKPSNVRNRKSGARLSFDVEHELNQERLHGNSFMDTGHERLHEEAIEESQVGNENQFRVHEWDQEVNWTNEVLCSNTVKYPGECIQELPISNAANQAQLFEFNEEIGYSNGAIDADYLDVPEEVVDEMHDYDGSDPGKQGRLKSSKAKKDAEKLAIELLAKRAFTAVELRKKLCANHFPLNVVQAVIRDFQVRGMINDRFYAETFSQSRWTSSSWGPRRIKHALSKKGISENDVENAVKLVFEDDEDGDRNSSLRLSNSALEQLFIQACKQWQRSQNVPYETRKARVIRWLQYRGFDWGVVSVILKKLESQHPP